MIERGTWCVHEKAGNKVIYSLKDCSCIHLHVQVNAHEDIMCAKWMPHAALNMPYASSCMYSYKQVNIDYFPELFI